MSFELETALPPVAPRKGPKPLPFVDLRVTKPDPAALLLAPSDFAIKNQVLPLYVERGTLVAAIGSEASLSAVDNLGILLDQPARAVLADPTLIQAQIEERFIERILGDLPAEDGQFADIDENDLANLQQMASETATVQMVNLIFAQAVR